MRLSNKRFGTLGRWGGRVSVSINAARERIFALINDLHGWDVWSPYEKRRSPNEENVTRRCTGEGAVYEGGRHLGGG
jgi:hypothetical protein